jgi:hypothetical protein
MLCILNIYLNVLVYNQNNMAKSLGLHSSVLTIEEVFLLHQKMYMSRPNQGEIWTYKQREYKVESRTIIKTSGGLDVLAVLYTLKDDDINLPYVREIDEFQRLFVKKEIKQHH